MKKFLSNHNDDKGAALTWMTAAGIVGADIGTSVFYSTSVLFPIVGYLAPFFVLTSCLMMWLFKRTYEEGLALSPYNGGAYSMILKSMGRRAALLAGALTFVSYLATAAVSALAGAFYFSSFFPESLSISQIVLISYIPLIGFGILNTRGIKEPAKIVTLIAAIHFALLIIISLWGLTYLMFHFSEIDFSKIKSHLLSTKITLPLLAYGFAASFLGITGFESAAQIIEQMEQPVLQTVRRLYKTVIILVSITAPFISLLCLTLLGQEEIAQNQNYLLSGLAKKIGGSFLLVLIIIDATLTLFAAVNTAFVGFIGLATTMAKQGNLPQIFLFRIAHLFPKIVGYPLIALPFAIIVMMMSSLLTGEVDLMAKVYEIAFLGVMVSFCIGVVLMRNRPFRSYLPLMYITKRKIKIYNRVIPLIPLISGLVLAFSTYILVQNSKPKVLLMLVVLLSGTIMLMAYYRWGLLEKRLKNRSDLRLGLGRYSHPNAELPDDFPKYALCCGGTGARRLINKTLRYILKKTNKAFELVIFHAEESQGEEESFFFELLQRVVSQQIAPTYKKDIILTVKILPGSLIQGLQFLKDAYKPLKVFIGLRRDEAHYPISEKIKNEIKKELEIEVVQIETNALSPL